MGGEISTQARSKREVGEQLRRQLGVLGDAMFFADAEEVGGAAFGRAVHRSHHPKSGAVEGKAIPVLSRAAR